jgi:hypothetical protein
MSAGNRERRTALAEAAARTGREVERYLTDGGRLGVVQAPPGSGKTSLLVSAVLAARKARMRVAVAAQTNTQVDSICQRLAAQGGGVGVVRFSAAGARAYDLGPGVTWESVRRDLPHGPSIVVGTTAKWGLVDIDDPYDVVLVEEAWQLAWADFMLLGQVGSRFLLIGDPGQIPPVVTVEVARWETAPRPPHLPAPEVIRADGSLSAQPWSLPATRRLPSDAAQLVSPFYDFPFEAFAAPGDRQVVVDGKGHTPEERAVDLLKEGTVVGVTMPTPEGGPPMEQDRDLAAAAARVVQQLLRRSARVTIDGKGRLLQPEDVGLCATHRVMNTALALSLPKALQGRVVVDTPERWQGLERPVMLVVHPLSGVVTPSAFDLETGRLCVMASRHLAGMIVLARDHVSSTLGAYIPQASQPVGRPDIEGRGLRDNVEFWDRLERGGRIVALSW